MKSKFIRQIYLHNITKCRQNTKIQLSEGTGKWPKAGRKQRNIYPWKTAIAKGKNYELLAFFAWGCSPNIRKLQSHWLQTTEDRTQYPYSSGKILEVKEPQKMCHSKSEQNSALIPVWLLNYACLGEAQGAEWKSKQKLVRCPFLKDVTALDWYVCCFFY